MNEQPTPREVITIVRSTAPHFASGGRLRPFIRLASIPEKYQLVFLQQINGSGCPAPDDRRDAFWEGDVERFLRVVGVQVNFVDAASDT